jgi:hypothetical protein
MNKLSFGMVHSEENGGLRMASFIENMALLLSGTIPTARLRGNTSILMVFFIEN